MIRTNSQKIGLQSSASIGYDVDAGVQRPADRVDGIGCGHLWIEETRHRVVV